MNYNQLFKDTIAKNKHEFPGPEQGLIRLFQLQSLARRLMADARTLEEVRQINETFEHITEHTAI